MLGTILALIAAGLIVSAVGADPLDIAVGQEPAVGLGIDLAFADFADQPVFGQLAGEMLRQLVVLRAGGAAEMIEAEPEAPCDFGLNGMHFRAVFRDGLARLFRRQFGRGAMLVGGAEEQNLVAASALVAGIKIGRQLAAYQIPQMLDPVDIRYRRCDQMPCHVAPRSNACACFSPSATALPACYGRQPQRESRLPLVNRPMMKLVRGVHTYLVRGACAGRARRRMMPKITSSA